MQCLDDEQREASRQLFMRLVTVGRDSDTRRVVPASELITLDVDIVTMHGAVEAFVANRLLVRDRDTLSGALTLEVAHEALLTEWERLRRWIDDGRDDLRQHAAYTVAVDEWLTAGRDREYLLTGSRLEQFEHWRATTTMRLTACEQEFLDDALRRRDEADAAEIERVAEQARLRRRGRRRAFALGAAVAAIAAGALVAVMGAAGTSRTARIAVVTSNDSAAGERATLYEQGLIRAERDFDLDVERHGRATGTVVSDLAASDKDLVILDSDAARAIAPDELDPSTRYVVTDYDGTKFDALPNVTIHQWAQEQAGFLAGVAAATTTQTGTVGFLGATRGGQEEYRAGFEAGVESIDPDVNVLAVYLTAFGYRSEPDDTPAGAREVAGRLYESGADVIFHVAGRSGVGVLDAASDLSTNKRWAIGVGADLWPAATTRQQPHILMSIVNRFDVEMYGIIEDHLGGSLEPGSHRLTVADGMISYVAHGDDMSTDAGANVDRAIRQIASGDIRPPRSPTGPRTGPEALLGPGTGTASFGDVPVTFIVPDGWSNSSWTVTKGDAGLRAGVHGGRQHLYRLLPVGAARPAGRSDR